MFIPSIKIPWQVLLCAGLFISIWGYGKYNHYIGARSVQLAWDKAEAANLAVISSLRKEQGRVTEKIVTVTKEKIKIIKEKGDVIVKQVKILVPSDSCELPGGFRLLHDAAASNTIPRTAEGVNAKPVPSQTAATTIAENYTICHEAISDLRGLRSWVTAQRQVYLDLCKESPESCSKDR